MPAVMPRSEQPLPGHPGALTRGQPPSYLSGGDKQKEVKANLCLASSMQTLGAGGGCQGGWVLSCSRNLADLKNPQGNPRSTSRGHAQAPPPQQHHTSPPRHSPLAAPQAPGPIEVRLPGSGSEGGRGQAPVSPLGCQGGTGLAAMPAHPPASASLPPRCHSNALRPPPQHPAAQGLDRGTWGWHSPLSPPHTALGLEQTIPGCPRIPLPAPAMESTAPRLSLPFSGEKGDAHTAASAASSPRSTQDRGLLCAQRGLGAMEVMKYRGEKPRLGPPLYSARTQGWHRGARPRKARDQCFIFGPTSRRGWHFKNFTDHPRCCWSSNRWTGLAGGVHSPHGAARKAMVAFAWGGGVTCWR